MCRNIRIDLLLSKSISPCLRRGVASEAGGKVFIKPNKNIHGPGLKSTPLFLSFSLKDNIQLSHPKMKMFLCHFY